MLARVLKLYFKKYILVEITVVCLTIGFVLYSRNRSNNNLPSAVSVNPTPTLSYIDYTTPTQITIIPISPTPLVIAPLTTIQGWKTYVPSHAGYAFQYSSEWLFSPSSEGYGPVFKSENEKYWLSDCGIYQMGLVEIADGQLNNPDEKLVIRKFF